jgi:hypothetical protein
MILASYRHECDAAGKRGAYRRTAERYGCSADTVERLVHRAEAEQRRRDATPAELQYTPLDAAYERERAAANARFAAELAAKQPPTLSNAATVPLDINTDGRTGNAANVGAHGLETPQPHTAERRTPTFDETPPAPRQTPQNALRRTAAAPRYHRPAERRVDSLTAWYSTHPALTMQLTAFAVAAMLVLLAF